MENIEKDFRAGGMLWLDMGTGKTFISLGLIFDNIDKVHTTLVIVPKILLYNWEQEFKRYQQGRPEVTFKNYYGLDVNQQSFDENIIITTYDSIKLNDKYLQIYFDRIILDESQNIRNHKNKISKQILNLKAYKKWCLSGTPFFNNYKDMYSQCLFIDKAPFNNKKLWKNPTNEFLEEFRREFCYTLKKEDVLIGDKKLPGLHHNNINIQLTKSEKKVYDMFKNMLNEGGKTLNYLIKIRQTCCNPKVMTKVNNNCSLCTDITFSKYKCGHFLCRTCLGRNVPKRTLREKKCPICKIDSSKFDNILKIINNTPQDEKLVIFTQWKKMGELLKKFLKQHNIKNNMIDGSVSLYRRNQMIESFKNDNKKVIIATIQTCGTGINLTCANHVILLDNWWNSSLEKQAIDRLYRIGQKKQVYVYHLIVKQSIERWINFKQKQKKIQNKILFEKDNKQYKWLGESYGIYSDRKGNENIKKSRFLTDKRMSRLSMNSCLDREKIYTYKVNPLIWIQRNIAARKIQRFMKTIVRGKKQTRISLTQRKEIPIDIVDMICSFTYCNKKDLDVEI